MSGEDESILESRQPAFLTRLWRGQIGLGKTYWIYGALIGFGIRLLSPAITYLLVSNATSLSAFDISAISTLWFIFVIAYSCFISVAIWKSANAYRKSKPQRRKRADLAQGAVILGILTLIASVAKALTANTLDISTPLSQSVDEKAQLQATIAGLNADLPKQVDASTYLRRIDVKDGKWTYFYTLSVPITNPSFVSFMKNKYHQQCLKKEYKELVQSSGPLVYIYTDSLGVTATVVMSKIDCGV